MALRNIRGLICTVDPDGCKFFTRGQDIGVEPCSFLILKNFIRLNSNKKSVLFIHIHHCVKPGSGSFYEQVARTQMDVSVFEASVAQDGNQAPNLVSGTLGFEAKRRYTTGLLLVDSELNMKDRTFWCFASAKRQRPNVRVRSNVETCGSCKKRRIGGRCPES